MLQSLQNLLARVVPSRYILKTCMALIEREQVGLNKYGVALDCGKYTHEQLLQHLYEELLDAANYTRVAIDTAREGHQEYALLRKGLEQFMRDRDRPSRYQAERSYQEGFYEYERLLKDFLMAHDSAAVLRQLSRTR